MTRAFRLVLEFFADQPIWLFLVILLIEMSAMWILNNLYFGWLHRGQPGLFRPRVLLAILALCIGTIAVGLVVNPPSEIRKSIRTEAQPQWVASGASAECWLRPRRRASGEKSWINFRVLQGNYSSILVRFQNAVHDAMAKLHH